ncbi:PKD domain-containing protein [Flavobacterium sp. RHBU_24]|uniref:PKD domain-containing protein n=1 Tax=Flavobacterium sp. RHBU_24 TaxID=3391185 RepID=UPI0039849F4B
MSSTLPAWGTWPQASGNWTIINKTGSQYWGYNTSVNPIPKAYEGPGTPPDNHKCAYIPGTFPTLATDWLISPQFTVPNQAQLRFWCLAYGWITSGTSLKVYIGTNPSDMASFTEIGNLGNNWVSSSYYQEVVVDFPANTIGTQRYVAIVCTGGQWLVDELSVASAPPCNKPTNINFSNVTSSSFDVSWNPGNAIQWEVQIDDSSDVTPGTNTIVVNQPTLSVTSTSNGQSLVPSHTYYVKVRAICNTSPSKSPWLNNAAVQTYPVGTLCSAPYVLSTPSLPFVGTNYVYLPTGTYYSDNDIQSGCSADSNSVFTGLQDVYSFTAPVTGDVDVSIIGESPGMSLYVYGSCSDIGVNCLGGDTGETSLVNTVYNLHVTAGQTYYIVTQFDGSPKQGHYSLTITPSNSCTSNIVSGFGVTNCTGTQFNATAYVQSTGTTQPITATAYNNGVVAGTQNVTGAGQVQFGPFSSSANVTIVLQNQQNPNCFLISGTLNTNDCTTLCTGAPTITVGATGNCNYIAGSLSGAPVSTIPLANCTPAPLAELWYQFTATSSTEHIQVTGPNGNYTNLKFAVYTGACAAVTQVYCGNSAQNTVTGLTVGQIYYVRVYATSLTDDLDFNLCVIASADTCANTNALSPTVKSLFTSLINHLFANRAQITTLVDPYTCSELTALAPYISDATPKIYNFTATPTTISFNFANHGTQSFDVVAVLDQTGPLSTIEFTGTYAAGSFSNVAYIQNNSTTSDDYFTNPDTSGHVRHIDFCPTSSLCVPAIAGSLDIPVTLSCIVAGQATTINFSSTATGISGYVWKVYKADGTLFSTTSNTSPSVSVTLPTAGYYTLELKVTKSTGCYTMFYKTIIVKQTCTGAGCTESYTNSNTIKNLYMALVNHLLGLYPGNQVTLPYTCNELTALAPYLSDPNPKIYNIDYNYSTNTLYFSFGNHAEFDVIVKDLGIPVADVDISSFASSQDAFSAFTVYQNGMTTTNHQISHIKFCNTNECPDFSAAILLPDVATCVLQGTTPQISYVTSAPSVSSVLWQVFATGSSTPLYTSPNASAGANLAYTFGAVGNFTIKLTINYSAQCSKTFAKNITVVSSTGSCPPLCETPPTVNVNLVGNCQYTAGSFVNGTLSSVPLTNCTPAPVADVWYQFVATSSTQYIQVTGFSGIDSGIKFAVYQGECNALSQLYCSNLPQGSVGSLVPGATYKLRVYATSVLTPVTFQLCITGTNPGPIVVTNPPITSCINEPQNADVKTLFVNLVNHLIQNSATILSAGTPYNCTELVNLSPYITDTNPKIYNFSVIGNNLYFNFSNHGTQSYDVIVKRPNSNTISNVVGTGTFDFNNPSTVVYIQGNADYSDDYFVSANNTGQVKHINFCPPVPCDIVGTVDINPGLSCVLPNTNALFSFVSNTAGINQWSWLFYDFDGNIIYTANTPEVTTSFSYQDSYYLTLTVTLSSGCQKTFYKMFSVSQSCPSSCTEQDYQSVTVKNLYINLVNKLLALYPQSPVTAPYICDELIALSPYLDETNPKIYNIAYNTTTKMLTFAFGNHSGYDVSIYDYGPLVSDIDISNFTASGTQFSANAIRENGTASGTHTIKHVKFCPGTGVPCPDITAEIFLDSAVSCVLQNSLQTFYFLTAATNINSYQWTFLAADNTTPLYSVSNVSHPSYTYTTAGNYLVRLVINYGSNCTKTVYKNITVSAPGTSACATYCTESNELSQEVKAKYKAFLNKILMMHYTNNSIQNGTGFAQLTALAPYIADNQPAIFNKTYISATNTIRLSFGQHGTSYDVSLPVPSPYAFVSDINIMPYSATAEGLQTLTLVYTNGTTSSAHQVRHINFCPQVECGQYPGYIAIADGISCVSTGQPVEFSYAGNNANIETYLWSFYDQYGHPDGNSSLPSFEKTYGQVGTYKINLTVTLDNGCSTTYTKTITVSTNCPSECTETNELTETVRGGFMSLINNLFSLTSAPEDGYLSSQVDDLAPFITDSNPRIYNASYSGQTLSFSFSDAETQPDVVIKNYGNVTDVNLVGFSSETGNTTILIGYSDGTSEYATVKHIKFCPPVPPCNKHIAFVIDESGSISADDALKIKFQLSEFVRQQKEMDAGTYISFIGMSDSDNDTRQDHVYQIPSTDAAIEAFDAWLAKYKTAYTPSRKLIGISSNADYWASGLKAAMQMEIRPELVVVITDGSETSNLNGLKEIISDIRQNSHLYVYGIGTGSYVNLNALTASASNQSTTNQPISEVTGFLKSSLKYLFDLPTTQFPIADQSTIGTADYFEYPDFNHLAADARYFSDKIAAAGFGCGGYVVPKSYCNDCETFQPSPGQYYISGWVKEQHNIQVKNYEYATVKLLFEDSAGTVLGDYPNGLLLHGSGDIIEGWQRFASVFTIPSGCSILKMEFLNLSPNIPVYFDDIRLHPVNGSMKTYVYDPETFKLVAELDDNNYSTFYEYDKEGGLVRIKKETSQGVKTIQESRSGSVITPVQN